MPQWSKIILRIESFYFLLPLTLRKNRKNCKNIFFGLLIKFGLWECPIWPKMSQKWLGLLIKFESFDLTVNGLKRLLLWSSTINHHVELGSEGSEGAQYCRTCPKSDFWTIDQIWIIWLDCKWSKTVPIMVPLDRFGWFLVWWQYINIVNDYVTWYVVW